MKLFRVSTVDRHGALQLREAMQKHHKVRPGIDISAVLMRGKKFLRVPKSARNRAISSKWRIEISESSSRTFWQSSWRSGREGGRKGGSKHGVNWHGVGCSFEVFS